MPRYINREDVINDWFDWYCQQRELAKRTWNFVEEKQELPVNNNIKIKFKEKNVIQNR